MSAAAAVSLDTLGDHPLPSLDTAGDKEARGAILVVAGGAQVPGAPVLTGLAALRAGAGKLQLAAPADSAVPLGLAVPEAAVVVTDTTPDGEFAGTPSEALRQAVGRARALVIGPGLMDGAAAGALAQALVAASPTAGVVLDAAAMTGWPVEEMAGIAAGRLVLTPHAGEMARISGRAKREVEADPLGVAREVARAAQATVIMKGATSYVVSPDGRAWRHDGGVVGLATSGSGDVLAGVVGGLLARGAAPLVAALWGVCAHAAAGRRLSQTLGPVGFLARELLAEIPGVLAEGGAPA